MTTHAPGGSGRPAPGADPARHRQPARQRDDRGGAPARVPRRTAGSSASSTRARPSGPTSSRASPAGRRAAASRFLSHTDTVRRRSGRVARDPWSGDLADGRRLGPRRARHEGPGGGRCRRDRLARARGLSAAPAISSSSPRPTRRSGRRRLQWLCAGASGRRPRRLRDQRGRRRPSRLGGRLYLCSSAEKMTAPFRLRVHGRSGHASMPGIADNALVKAARADRAARRATGPSPRSRAGDRGVPARPCSASSRQRRRCWRGARAPPARGALIEPLLSLTLSPTMIAASELRNVIPALCDVTVDCRLLPGTVPRGGGGADPRRASRARRGRLRADVAGAVGRDALPTEAPLWDASRRWVDATSSPARRRCRSARRASRTATGCATRSGPSRTASSRCGRWIPRSRRCSSTRPTSAMHVDDLELGVEFLRSLARSLE